MHDEPTVPAPTANRHRRAVGATVLVVVLMAATLALGAAAAAPVAAQGCAPQLAVSKTSNLAPDGETVSVAGTCFDDFKGIYVAFCVVPPPGTLPTPCGGGVDKSGAGGLSAWISSNPPPEGVGLAIPYDIGGSFSVTMTPSATLNPTVDCRRVSCAIVTRNDHTRSSDRSQDVIIPITFAADVAPAAPPVFDLPPPPTTAAETTTTLAPETTTTIVVVETTTTGVAETDEVTELAADSTSSDGGTGSGGAVLVGLVVAVLVVGIAGGGWWALRRNRSTPSAP